MPSPLPQQIADTIRELRAQYLAENRASSYYEINNGICDQFADDAVKILERQFGESKLMFAIGSENFYRGEYDETWDGDLLRSYWGMEPPASLSWLDLNNINFGGHVWFVCDKRHYDAECPAGVDNFFDLPIFRRSIVLFLRKNGIECDDVVTDDVSYSPAKAGLSRRLSP